VKLVGTQRLRPRPLSCALARFESLGLNVKATLSALSAAAPRLTIYSANSFVPGVLPMRADVSTVYCKPRTHRRAIFATYKIQKLPTCNVRVRAEVQVHERIVDAEVLVVQHVVVRVVVEPAGGLLLARVPLPSGTWYPQCQSRRQYSLRTISGVLYKRAGWAGCSTAQVQRPKGSRNESDEGSRCGAYRLVCPRDHQDVVPQRPGQHSTEPSLRACMMTTCLRSRAVRSLAWVCELTAVRCRA
jgi:hypothetical protein